MTFWLINNGYLPSFQAVCTSFKKASKQVQRKIIVNRDYSKKSKGKKGKYLSKQNIIDTQLQQLLLLSDVSSVILLGGKHSSSDF